MQGRGARRHNRMCVSSAAHVFSSSSNSTPLTPGRRHSTAFGEGESTPNSEITHVYIMRRDMPFKSAAAANSAPSSSRNRPPPPLCSWLWRCTRDGPWRLLFLIAYLLTSIQAPGLPTGHGQPHQHTPSTTRIINLIIGFLSKVVGNFFVCSKVEQQRPIFGLS